MRKGQNLASMEMVKVLFVFPFHACELLEDDLDLRWLEETLCKNGEWTSRIFWAPRKLAPLFFLTRKEKMRKFILKFLFLDFFAIKKYSSV